MSVTTTQFAEALLTRLGLPRSENNIRSLVAFQAQEGGHENGAWFNPLNTMRGTPTGDKDLPSVNFTTGKVGPGVQAFESWHDGLEATARTMEQSNMRSIFEALKASAPPVTTVDVIARSPWGWKGVDHSAADAIARSGSYFESAARKVYRGAGTLAAPAAKYGPWIFGGALVVGGVIAIVAISKRSKRRRLAREAETAEMEMEAE